MKKIIALILTFLFLTANSGFAFSELYYLYSVDEQKVNSLVKEKLGSLNYRLESENPYYAIDNRNPKDNAVIIVQQSGNNVFYYYYSADKGNTQLNNAILKTFKNYRINYEKQSYNSNIMNVYDNIAQKTISAPSLLNQYNFGDNTRPVYPNSTNSTTYQPAYSNTVTTPLPAQNNVVTLPAYPPTNNTITYNNNTNHGYTLSANNNNDSYLTPGTIVKSQQATVLKGSVVSVGSGTKIKTYLQNPINTSSAQKGDRVIAVLTDDLKYNGVVVAPQGSLVYGTLTKARHATYGSRNGRVVIEFNQMVTPENKTYDIETEKIDFTVTNDGKVGRTVGNAVAGAAVGALAGLLFGALGDYSLGTAAAIGAGVGAGTSLIGSGVERGVDAEIPSFTELELTLTKPFRVTVNY